MARLNIGQTALSAGTTSAAFGASPDTVKKTLSLSLASTIAVEVVDNGTGVRPSSRNSQTVGSWYAGHEGGFIALNGRRCNAVKGTLAPEVFVEGVGIVKLVVVDRRNNLTASGIEEAV